MGLIEPLVALAATGAAAVVVVYRLSTAARRRGRVLAAAKLEQLVAPYVDEPVERAA